MAKKNHPIFKRKIKMGMLGGGPGAFIGEVHRKAARMDGQIELVAGAFDIDPKKSKQMGKELFLDNSRVYGTYQEMIKSELALPEGERVDFVSICTPNFTHFPIARDFLKAGIHVVCEKPMTLNTREAKELQKLVKKTGRAFAVMHGYTAYPMVKLARDLVAKGELGTLRKIEVRYIQGWLSQAIEKSGQMQASWRTDPKKSGAAGCMGDIGTHAENLVENITGLRIQEVCADLSAFVKGRRLDDDGNCLIHWNKGVKGILFASQISIGEENGLGIKIYGDKKALEWKQEDPNYLIVKEGDGTRTVYKTGNECVAKKSAAAARATRLPAGHPEGLLEAFANIYSNFAETVRVVEAGIKPDKDALDFPNVEDGLRGMQFIDAVVKSAKMGAKWVKMPK